MGMSITGILVYGCILDDGPDAAHHDKFWPSDWLYTYEDTKKPDFSYNDYDPVHLWDKMLDKEWDDVNKGEEQSRSSYWDWRKQYPVDLICTACRDNPIFVLGITSTYRHSEWGDPFVIPQTEFDVPDSEQKKAYDWVRKHGWKNIEFEWVLASMFD